MGKALNRDSARDSQLELDSPMEQLGQRESAAGEYKELEAQNEGEVFNEHYLKKLN